VLVTVLAIVAEVHRGLFLSLADIVRAVLALLAGFAAFALFRRMFHSYTAGFVGFGIAAIAVVLLVRFALEAFHLNPSWGRSVAGRVAGGFIGLGLGCLITAVFIPVFGRTPAGEKVVTRSAICQPFLATLPGVYHFADWLDMDLPMLNSRAARFEDEGSGGQAGLVERVNYSKLDGATCIECGSPVRFDGYFRRVGVSVSPRFTCTGCGRTSDGCQTYEGFHLMYGHCPVDVAGSLGPIDCGVWPNNRPVYPSGTCPVDGKHY